jgi:signal transduction histidine kinase
LKRVRFTGGAEIRRCIRSHLTARSATIAAAFLLLSLVGIADYVTGFSFSFSVFYLLPIILAGWRLGSGFAYLIAVLSVFFLNASDLLAGQRAGPGLLLVWNALIQLFFYLIVIWLLMRWKGLHEALEAGVRERTRDLTAEIAVREELESKILTISEREQRRIGCNLHDVLCQHLAATALAAKVL